MRHSPSAMYPRTALLTGLIDLALNRKAPVTDPVELNRRRAATAPTWPPFSWLLGRVDRSVGITFGTAPARDGYEIPLRLYRPRAVPDTRTDVPVIVFIHGGGFTEGNVVNFDPLCTLLAAEVGAVVASVDYRLAPEHPAPTAALDAIDAATWLASQGSVLRADTTRLGVVGDSAGGNLAAVVAQAFRDAGSTALRHQALIYPAVDFTLQSPSIHRLTRAPMLTRRMIDASLALYTPDAALRTNPMVSPILGRLDGVAPALIQTADLDPLRDDGLRYAEALRSAGVEVRVTNYLRVPHGFASIPGAVPIAAQHRAELVSELRSHLCAADAPQPGLAG